MDVSFEFSGLIGLVPTVNSVCAYSRKSGDAYANGRWAQTDLVGDHPAGPIKGFARGGDPAAPPAQRAAKKIAEAARFQQF